MVSDVLDDRMAVRDDGTRKIIQDYTQAASELLFLQQRTKEANCITQLPRYLTVHLSVLYIPTVVYNSANGSTVHGTRYPGSLALDRGGLIKLLNGPLKHSSALLRWTLHLISVLSGCRHDDTMYPVI